MYFVTESGKMHLARKTDKGRTWQTVWDDPKRPVSAILVDEDRKGKVILCGYARQRIPLRSLPFLFALSAKPQVQLFEADDIKPVKAPRPLDTLAEFAQLAGKVR